MEPSRYACTVLDEARAAIKNLNHLTLLQAKRHLSTLIEEMQTVYNRMESGLEDKESYETVRGFLREVRAELKEERAELEKAAKELKAINADIEYYTEVRTKILKEALEADSLHSQPIEILGKGGLQ
jgi:DNA-binding transcriptional MerR regulator